MIRKEMRRFVKVCIAGLFFATVSLVLPQVNVAAADKEEAVLVTIGEEVEDSLSEKTEEDWYSFTTPTTESGNDSWFEITQSYSNKKENGYPPSLYLYDDKEKQVIHVSPSNANEDETEYVLLEQDKTYYVKMASECQNDTADYRFTITELEDEAGETMETAANLEKNMTNRFETQSFDDEDWFYVESDIEKPSLTIKNANVVSLTIGIYDIDGVKLDEFAVDKSKSETFKLNLEDKNIYIRVYSYYSTMDCIGSYTIALNDQVKVTKVSLNKSKVEVKAGKSFIIKATVTPSTATNKRVIWKSSNTAIATVDKYGKVIAKKAGAVIITCTTNDGSKKKATCKITVKQYAMI